MTAATPSSPLAAIAPAVTDVLANLARDAEQSRGAISANTERALRGDSLVWSRWCAGQGMEPLPAVAPEALAAFIDAMAETKKPATIRRYVASISRMHVSADVPDQNPAKAKVVKYALQRMHRGPDARAQTHAKGLNRPAIEDMLDAAGDKLVGRNRALLAVAYDTLARRSELVAMLAQDIALAPDGSGNGTIAIRRSKTDAEGRGAKRFLALHTLGLIEEWRTTAGISDGLLFRAVSKGGKVSGELDPRDVARTFQGMAKAAGMDAAGISAHSTRVGAAQDMVAIGVGLPQVMQSGGWRTPEMVSRYTADLEAQQSGAAFLARHQYRTRRPGV